MTIIGPFWRERPTTSTTAREYGWCMLWLDRQGRIAAIEWLGLMVA